MAVPRIAITPGEPAGIGPDVVLMVAQQSWEAELVVYADPDLLAQRAQALNLPLALMPLDTSGRPQVHRPGSLRVRETTLATAAVPGELNPANARYVMQTLRNAVHDCMALRCHAMVTGPVQKSVINDAGIPFIGHTEFLQQETNSPRVVMMLATRKMRVALATTHLALKDVPQAITPTLLLETLSIVHSDMQTKFAIRSPRIAVLGLNPHAGEGGHMGKEEIDTLIPVLESLRAQGMDLRGPLPADTAFNPKVLQDCDAVFAMYHDQGLPVLKFSGFGQAINITLGLPIIRTSVDHGTALDLAASGSADASSLEQALKIACQLSQPGAGGV